MATTLPDTPPQLVSAGASSATEVQVIFSEPLDQTTAETAAHYQIDNGVTVSGASLTADANIVVLATSSLSTGITYTLTVNNVTDTAGNPIAANSQTSFEYTEYTYLSVSYTHLTLPTN